ncbi:MAG TPA: hypothetical protein VKZ67_07625 [Natronosporangium sp.]|nr:hypothetical protein [Natronosporangium sp.]
MWALEDGVTLRRLGDRQRATERIHAGLAGLPAQWHAADWLAQYRAILTDEQTTQRIPTCTTSG